MPESTAQVETGPKPATQQTAQPPSTPEALAAVQPPLSRTDDSYESIDKFLYGKESITVPESAVDVSRATPPPGEQPAAPAPTSETPAAPVTPAPETPAAPAAQPAPPPVEPVTPPVAATPETPAATVPETPPATPETPTPPVEPAAEPAKPEGARIHFRTPTDAAIAEVKKNRGCSWAEAESIVMGTAPQPTTPTKKRSETLADEITALDEQITAADPQNEGVLLTGDLRKLMDDKAAKVAERQVALLREEGDAADKEDAVRETLLSERKDSRDKILGTYPAAAIKTTPLGSLVTDTIEEWSNENHPRHKDLFQANSPEIVINAAVKQLARTIAITKGISVEEAEKTLRAPVTPAAPETPPAQPPSTATPETPQPKRVPPASGALRQSPQPAKKTEAEVLKEIGNDPDKIDAALFGATREMVIR